MLYRVEARYKAGHPYLVPGYFFIQSECEKAAKDIGYPLTATCVDSCYCELARKKLIRSIKKLQFRRARLFMCYGIKIMYYDFIDWLDKMRGL